MDNGGESTFQARTDQFIYNEHPLYFEAALLKRLKSDQIPIPDDMVRIKVHTEMVLTKLLMDTLITNRYVDNQSVRC